MYMYMYIVHVRMYLVGFCGCQLEGLQSKGHEGGGSVCGAPLLIGDRLEEISHNLCTHTQVSNLFRYKYTSMHTVHTSTCTHLHVYTL